jgi:hypothetical protein
MKNHRCAQVQEQREPAEELRHGQKLWQALAEPLANLVCPAWLEYESKSLLEPQHHCVGCRQAAFHRSAWLPCALYPYLL